MGGAEGKCVTEGATEGRSWKWGSRGGSEALLYKAKVHRIDMAGSMGCEIGV